LRLFDKGVIEFFKLHRIFVIRENIMRTSDTHSAFARVILAFGVTIIEIIGGVEIVFT
jgi:hypothetical protein